MAPTKKELPAFPLAPSERKELLNHLVELLMADQKKVLIALFVRLLIQGEEDAFKFLKELDKDSPVFFNFKTLEEFVFSGEWVKVKEYLLKFFHPDDKIFRTLSACREDVTFVNISRDFSVLLFEAEVEKNRKFSEWQLSKDVKSSVPDIPLLSLVEAVNECINVDETALMAMVEDFKLKAARKRERAQSLLLKSDTAVYKAAMAVHLAQAAEDLGLAEKVADLLDDDDNNSVKDDT